MNDPIDDMLANGSGMIEPQSLYDHLVISIHEHAEVQQEFVKLVDDLVADKTSDDPDRALRASLMTVTVLEGVEYSLKWLHERHEIVVAMQSLAGTLIHEQMPAAEKWEDLHRQLEEARQIYLEGCRCIESTWTRATQPEPVADSWRAIYDELHGFLVAQETGLLAFNEVVDLVTKSLRSPDPEVQATARVSVMQLMAQITKEIGWIKEARSMVTMTREPAAASNEPDHPDLSEWDDILSRLQEQERVFKNGVQRIQAVMS